jgi:hypothetical protein
MPMTKPRVRISRVRHGGNGERSCHDGRSPAAVQAEAGHAAVLRIQEPGLKAAGGDRARVSQRDARPCPGGARWARRAFVRVGFHAARAHCELVPSPLELRGATDILGLVGCFFMSSSSPAGAAVFLAGRGRAGTPITLMHNYI